MFHSSKKFKQLKKKDKVKNKVPASPGLDLQEPRKSQVPIRHLKVSCGGPTDCLTNSREVGGTLLALGSRRVPSQGRERWGMGPLPSPNLRRLGSPGPGLRSRPARDADRPRPGPRTLPGPAPRPPERPPAYRHHCGPKPHGSWCPARRLAQPRCPGVAGAGEGSADEAASEAENLLPGGGARISRRTGDTQSSEPSPPAEPPDVALSPLRSRRPGFPPPLRTN
jgi:hypothetical protein